jgi:hypothetical protein
MATADRQPQSALTYRVHARDDGGIEIRGPFRPGESLTVIVIPDIPNEFDDLTAAAGSSLDFWDNAFDDEDWNAASAG